MASKSFPTPPYCMSPAIRALLIDDHQLVRAGLQVPLEPLAFVTVVGTGATAAGAGAAEAFIRLAAQRQLI